MAIPAINGVDASGLPPAGDQATAYVGGSFAAVGPGRSFAFRGPMNLAIWSAINTTLTTTARSLTASVASATGLAIGDAINSVNVPAGTTVGNLSGTTVTLAPPTVTYPVVANASSATVSGLPAGVSAGLVGATVTCAYPGVVIPGGTTVLSSPTDGTIILSNAVTSIAASKNTQPQFDFALAAAAITTSGADAAALFTGAAISYSATIQLERSFDGGKTWLVCNIGSSGVLAQWSTGTPVNLTFGEPERQTMYRLNCIAYTSGAPNYRISQTGGANESLAIGPLTGG